MVRQLLSPGQMSIHFRPPASLDELRAMHSAFMERSWKDRPLAELAQEFAKVYGELFVLPLELTCREMGCNELHRARWLDPQAEDVSDPLTFSYPRDPAKQVLGRANLPGAPAFYTCGEAFSSMYEARKPELGKELFHSEWIFNDDRTWKVVVMIPLERLEKKDVPFHRKWENAFREALLQSEIPDDHFVLYYNCLVELFHLEEHNLPAWMAHTIMRKQEMADVLLYPSLMTDTRTLCHAFHTSPIDQGRILLNKVSRLPMGVESEHPASIGRVRNGRIDWSAETPSIRRTA